ncbi:MAG: hypothetical protein RBR47_05405 [Bacteroidales bacterium]|jgi:hypothetical protein|nr:hypothetical protein [Bacteroidales bacterium]NCU35410.1 hypothetical protein [Candidatus Falkowbacteria bacterium]MDD2632141.1 hypothetical protein [Bacteroidales bacterium]MDD3132189.1 hypothetical protein [Bacteroidales bacterium]MDD3525684.1 hypothetical protein [Bacteroidales bacterium]
MKEMSFEIKPLEGFGALKFGNTPKQIVERLGEPDDKEEIVDEDMGDSIIYHYDDMELSLFFEVDQEPVLTQFETENRGVTLFGKKLFDLNEAQIVKLMNDHEYDDIDTEMMEDEDYENEKRVSFDDALIDFYFDDGALTAISWGMMMDLELEEDDDDEA